MPAPRKYDQETRDRAVRMYRERRQRHPAESAIESRRQVGALIDVKSETLRGWIERDDVDAGARPGTTTEEHAELVRLRREVWRTAPCERHSEVSFGVFRSGGARPPTQVICAYIDQYRHQFGVEPI